MICPGMKAIIIWYDEDDYPDSWSSEMLEWREEVVTIRRVTKDGDVLIEEDGQEWVWNVEDFEPLPLPEGNPNRQYQIKKAHERIERFRAQAKANAAKPSF